MIANEIKNTPKTPETTRMLLKLLSGNHVV